MSDPIVVLPEDTTGLMPACKILGERHSPLPSSIRLLIPNFGAFYAEGLRLYDPVTNVSVSPEFYTCVDLWQEASERSGKEVFNTILITDTSVPAEIAIDYQGFGGPYSRNAHALVDWLSARRLATGGSQVYSELTDLPKQFEPGMHLHLLKHVYGMEAVIRGLGDVKAVLVTGPEGAWQDALFTVDQALERLRNNAGYTIESMVNAKYNEWKAGITLFNLGLDLVRDYPILDAAGFEAALGSFATPEPSDDRYVNVVGLGLFAKGMIERCVTTADTGLGVPFAVLNAPTRGSVFVAPVGATFTLPTPNVAATLLDAQLKIYPANYPLTNQFVVHKLAGNEHDGGCILMGFNPVTGEAYLGILTSAGCRVPLTWKRFYFQSDLEELESLVEAHAVTNNDPHDLTKDQIELGLVENLPITTVDDILARTGTRKFVTMDVLMYHMRAFMENASLPKDPNGWVDLDANPMSDAKIVFAPYKTSATGYDSEGKSVPPKGQFISSFCDGSDKYTRLTDGTGSFTDTLTQPDSDDCKFYNVPKHGEPLGEFCEGVNKKIKYADGKGGVYTELSHANSPECGYITPAKAGDVIATFCSGVNQMVRYADGKNGFYDMPSMINTYLCGGTIYPSGVNGGTDPSKPKIKIELASTHDKLYVGTTEVISLHFTGLTPDVSYKVECWVNNPTFQAGADYMTLQFSIKGDADGSFMKEVTAYDDGFTVPRGVYDCWALIPSETIESNHITRTFYAGEAPSGTNPNSGTGQTGAGGGTIGGGSTTDVGVDGLPYNPNHLWPLPPKYAPVIDFSTSSLIMAPGTSETQTITLTGFYANKAYTLSFWAQSPAFNNNVPVISHTESVTTDVNGSDVFTLNIYDDGTVPRGAYQCWITVDTFESNVIERLFSTSNSGTGYKYDPKIVYASSNTDISAGTTETQTVVMMGFEKNKLYTLSWKASTTYMGLYNVETETLTMVIQTDGNGYYRFERTETDDGVTVPRAQYQCWVSVKELTLNSNMIWRRFITNTVTPPPTTIPKLNISSSHSVVSPGTVETIVIRLTGFPVNKTFIIDGWIKSPALNANADFKTTTASIQTDGTGAGSYTVVTTDDGVTVPRGDYQCWVSCATPAVVSSKIVRSFIVGASTPAPTPAPTLANAVLIFSTDSPTITTGTIETFTVTLAGFVPNTSYNIEFWGSGAALNNGGQAIKSYTGQITVNSIGRGTFTLTNPADDGVTVPRGEFRCWIVVATVTSNIVIRTFIGTPKPTVVYNPIVVYSTSTTTITAGTTEVITGQLTGFTPNTSYSVQGWVQSPAYNNNTPFLSVTKTVVTDAGGKGSLTITTFDDGVTVPRGAYTSWFTVAAIPVSSNAVVRYFTGTPAPTAPPYNPQCSIYTNRSTLSLGVYETFVLTIQGMRPNTTYNITLYAQSPSVWGGVAGVVGTRSITTNSTGYGTITWGTTDDGTVPRGTYYGWAVIDATGTTSNTTTRVFI